MNMDIKKLLCGAVGLSVMLDVGCGGTIDLTKHDGGDNAVAGVGSIAGWSAVGGASAFAGAPPSVAGSVGIAGSPGGQWAGAPSYGGISAGGAPSFGGYEAVGGESEIAGCYSAGAPGSGGYYGATAGAPWGWGGDYNGVSGALGVSGYSGVSGALGVAGYYGVGGAIPSVGGAPGASGYSGVGGASAGADGQAQFSCVEDADCVECAAQTDPAISGCYVPCCASTAMNGTTCSHHWQTFFATCPNLACTAECVAKPKPRCVNNQCVHGTASP